jgi:hypothetical protein
MKKKAKKKAAPKRPVTPAVIHEIGDPYVVDGVECVVRFVNGNLAWLAPKQEGTFHGTHVAMAKVNEKGEVTKL